MSSFNIYISEDIINIVRINNVEEKHRQGYQWWRRGKRRKE